MIFAAALDVLVLLLGGFLTVRTPPPAQGEVADVMLCRLVMGFALFFAGFFIVGALGLFFTGRWVTILNSTLASLVLTAGVFFGVGGVRPRRQWMLQQRRVKDQGCRSTPPHGP